MSKYKHLGKAGSAAHIEALMQVFRRTQIEGLQRTVDALTQREFDGTRKQQEVERVSLWGKCRVKVFEVNRYKPLNPPSS